MLVRVLGLDAVRPGVRGDADDEEAFLAVCEGDKRLVYRAAKVRDLQRKVVCSW
jgi:hypothetical protein